MKHLDLFSGIGGFALAASWVWGDEHEIVSFVEIDKFCQKVLKKHWPDVPCHPDIKDYEHDGTAIDLLTGGFPCQPYSTAGVQRGNEDDRALWPAMLNVIEKVKPNWIIGENVAGSKNLVINDALSALEKLRYEARAFDIPACSRKAPHERRRIWIVAHTSSNGCRNEQKLFTYSGNMGKLQCPDSIFDWNIFQIIWKTAKATGILSGEPLIFRIDDGLSSWVDRVRGRIKALGNAIVPQVVVPIMQAIKQIEEDIHENPELLD